MDIFEYVEIPMYTALFLIQIICFWQISAYFLLFVLFFSIESFHSTQNHLFQFMYNSNEVYINRIMCCVNHVLSIEFHAICSFFCLFRLVVMLSVWVKTEQLNRISKPLIRKVQYHSDYFRTTLSTLNDSNWINIRNFPKIHIIK